MSNLIFQADIIWCGDSRVSLLLKDKNILLTKDHRPHLNEETNRIYKANGTITNINGIWRVEGQLAMSRAFGDKRFKNNLKLSNINQKVTALCEHKRILCKKGDKLLIYSDGLSDPINITNNDICNQIKLNLLNSSQSSDALSFTLDQIFNAGSCDNQSAILIELSDGTNYVTNDNKTYYFGPLYDNFKNDEFKKAYFKNAANYGFDNKLYVILMGFNSDILELKEKLKKQQYPQSKITKKKIENISAEIKKINLIETLVNGAILESSQKRRKLTAETFKKVFI